MLLEEERALTTEHVVLAHGNDGRRVKERSILTLPVVVVVVVVVRKHRGTGAALERKKKKKKKKKKRVLLFSKLERERESFLFGDAQIPNPRGNIIIIGKK